MSGVLSATTDGLGSNTPVPRELAQELARVHGVAVSAVAPCRSRAAICGPRHGPFGRQNPTTATAPYHDAGTRSERRGPRREPAMAVGSARGSGGGRGTARIVLGALWRVVHDEDEEQPQRHQVFELPEVNPHVTEYRIHSVCCERCGRNSAPPSFNGAAAGKRRRGRPTPEK